MSRSRRKTPICGIAGTSEKKDKKILHGKLRTRAREMLSRDPEDYIEPQYNEVHNVWSMAKDGKMYWPKKYENWWYYKKMMRK
jgi:hypothetical protein